MTKYFVNFTDLIISFKCEEKDSEKIIKEFIKSVNPKVKVCTDYKFLLLSGGFTKKEFNSFDSAKKHFKLLKDKKLVNPNID